MKGIPTRRWMTSTTSFDVVVLGGGMAGLRAAQVLREKHPQLSVVLLEGRSVAGGRIRWTSLPASSSRRTKSPTTGTSETTASHSSSNSTSTHATPQPPSLYIDEGAQYLHGICRKHPLRKVADTHHIPYQRFDWDEGPLLVGRDDTAWTDAQEDKEERAMRAILRRLANWQKLQTNNQHEDDVSLESIVQPFIQQVCQTDASLSATRLRALLDMEIADDYGADLADLSARSFDQDDVMSHTDAVPSTYQRLVEAVLAPIQDLVLYQHEVTLISFEPSSLQDSLVRLQCRTGEKDSDDEPYVELTARRVICTLPLGVLKQQSDQLFQPSLPVPLQASLGRLGYGCLEKVWLAFDNVQEPFWPTDTDVFYHAASATPFRSWFLPARVYNNADYRHTLCCFVSGAAARALADQSEESIGAAALEALGEIVPVGPQHILRHVHVTRWSIDSWSGRGTYSHMAVGSTASDYKVWTQSQGFYEQRLWFAGEATSARYPGTVHGAYFSGERAARDCLASLKGK